MIVKPRRTRLFAALLAMIVVSVPIAADERARAQPSLPRDSLRNGLLIGAGVGFGAGFLTMAAVNAAKTDSGPIWDGEALGIYTSAGLAGAAIGAGLGVVVDALHRHVTDIRSPRSWDAVPLIGARRGLAVVFRRGPG
jgi:nitrate/nitrite transporter NarK